MKTMQFADLASNLAAVLDEVVKERESYTFFSQGVPVAKLEALGPQLPPLQLGDDPLAAFRFPGLEIVGDVTAPLYSEEELEQFFEASARQLEGR